MSDEKKEVVAEAPAVELTLDEIATHQYIEARKAGGRVEFTHKGETLDMHPFVSVHVARAHARDLYELRIKQRQEAAERKRLLERESTQLA